MNEMLSIFQGISIIMLGYVLLNLAWEIRLLKENAKRRQDNE